MFFFKSYFPSAALLCAVLIYFGILPVFESKKLKSLVPLEMVSAIEGIVTCDPVRTSLFGGCFRVDVDAYSVSSLSGAASSACGRAVLLVPTAIVESKLPDGIYTASFGHGKSRFDLGSTVKVGVRDICRGMFVVDEVTSVGTGWIHGFVGRFFMLRGRCRLRFKQVMSSWGKAGGLFIALLSGCKDYTDAEVSEFFRNAGLSHILALSGMHLSLFGFISMSLGSLVSGRRISSVIYLLSILLFVWFAGLSPSLCRALLCAVLTFFISLLRLPSPNGISILSAVFLIHLRIFPAHALEISFILSYASLFGILMFSMVFEKVLSRFFIPSFSSSFSASFGAQLFTAPVCIVTFGRLTPIGIVSSVVMSPLVTLFIYVGLLGIISCSLAPFLSQPLSVIMNTIYDIIVGVASFFAGFPAFSFDIGN